MPFVPDEQSLGANIPSQGLIKPGNLDPYNRKVLNNSDGSVSTTSSASFNFDGKEVLIPTVVDGVRLTKIKPDGTTDYTDAIKHYRETGEHLGMFDTPEHADAYAQALHEDQARRMGVGQGSTAGRFVPDKPLGYDANTGRISPELADVDRQMRSPVTNRPQPSFMQSAGSYLGDYGRDIRRSLTGLAVSAGARPTENIGGALEAGLSLGTGMIAPFSAAMGSMVGNREVSPEEFTYQPRSQTGRSILDVLGEVSKPATDSGLDVALGPLAMEAGAMGPRVGNAPAAVHPEIANARALGLKLDPRQVIAGQRVGTPVQRVAATLGGKSAIPADASLANQARVQALVAEDLGLPAGETISPGTIDRLSSDANKAYTDLKGLRNSNGTSSFKVDLAGDAQYAMARRNIARDATSSVTGQMAPGVGKLLDKYGKPGRGVGIAGVVDDIAELRFDARKHFKSDDPAIVKEARAERKLADALESTLDRQVTPVAPELVKNWQNSRVKLAQLHSVEDALVGTEIDARILAKDVEAGGKLSGNMKRLAAAARNFSTSMQTGANLGSKSGLGLFDVGAAGVGGGLGMMVGGVPGMLAGMAIEPAVRLGSKRLALGQAPRLPAPRPVNPFPLVVGSATLQPEAERRRLSQLAQSLLD